MLPNLRQPSAPDSVPGHRTVFLGLIGQDIDSAGREAPDRKTGRRSALESSPALADTPPEIGPIGCAKSKANYRSAPIVERPFPKSTSPALIGLRPACR